MRDEAYDGNYSPAANEATGSNPLPPHVHAMMADDQAEILRLRIELATALSDAESWHRVASAESGRVETLQAALTEIRAEITATRLHGTFNGVDWLAHFDAITKRRDDV